MASSSDGEQWTVQDSRQGFIKMEKQSDLVYSVSCSLNANPSIKLYRIFSARKANLPQSKVFIPVGFSLDYVTNIMKGIIKIDQVPWRALLDFQTFVTKNNWFVITEQNLWRLSSEFNKNKNSAKLIKLVQNCKTGEYLANPDIRQVGKVYIGTHIETPMETTNKQAGRTIHDADKIFLKEASRKQKETPKHVALQDAGAAKVFQTSSQAEPDSYGDYGEDYTQANTSYQEVGTSTFGAPPAIPWVNTMPLTSHQQSIPMQRLHWLPSTSSRHFLPSKHLIQGKGAAATRAHKMPPEQLVATKHLVYKCIVNSLECKESYKTKTSFQTHLLRFHFYEEIRTKVDKIKMSILKPTECPIYSCGYIGPSDYLLLHHYSVHHSAVNRQLELYAKKNKMEDTNDFKALEASGFFKYNDLKSSFPPCKHCQRNCNPLYMEAHIVHHHMKDRYEEEIKNGQVAFNLTPVKCPGFNCKFSSKQPLLLIQHYSKKHMTTWRLEKKIVNEAKEGSHGINCPFVTSQLDPCPIKFHIHSQDDLPELHNHIISHVPNMLESVVKSVTEMIDVDPELLDTRMVVCPFGFCAFTSQNPNLTISMHIKLMHKMELLAYILQDIGGKENTLLKKMLLDLDNPTKTFVSQYNHGPDKKVPSRQLLEAPAAPPANIPENEESKTTNQKIKKDVNPLSHETVPQSSHNSVPPLTFLFDMPKKSQDSVPMMKSEHQSEGYCETAKVNEDDLIDIKDFGYDEDSSEEEKDNDDEVTDISLEYEKLCQDEVEIKDFTFETEQEKDKVLPHDSFSRGSRTRDDRARGDGGSHTESDDSVQFVSSRACNSQKVQENSTNAEESNTDVEIVKIIEREPQIPAEPAQVPPPIPTPMAATSITLESIDNPKAATMKEVVRVDRSVKPQPPTTKKVLGSSPALAPQASNEIVIGDDDTEDLVETPITKPLTHSNGKYSLSIQERSVEATTKEQLPVMSPVEVTMSQGKETSFSVPDQSDNASTSGESRKRKCDGSTSQKEETCNTKVIVLDDNDTGDERVLQQHYYYFCLDCEAERPGARVPVTVDLATHILEKKHMNFQPITEVLQGKASVDLENLSYNPKYNKKIIREWQRIALGAGAEELKKYTYDTPRSCLKCAQLFPDSADMFLHIRNNHIRKT